MAIAAVALSTLALTTTAVSAHAQTGSTSEESSGSSMSWAYYRGDLTDIWPEKDVYEDASATAMMISVGDASYFRVQLTGLADSAIGQRYGAHLHVGPCGITDPEDATTATVGGHYNTTLGLPLVVVNSQTEVWLNFRVDSEGNARDTANVPFVPTPGDDGAARSITFHALPTVRSQTDPAGPAVGSAGTKLACVPFKIKSYSR
jgi:hypothetical protein